MKKKIASISEAAARAATPCNGFASGGDVLIEGGKSITVMVNLYAMTAYYSWAAGKACDCKGKCKDFSGS